jgi:hypothetical protein
MNERIQKMIQAHLVQVYGVYDSREKSMAGAKAHYGDLYDTNILEREVK